RGAQPARRRRGLAAGDHGAGRRLAAGSRRGGPPVPRGAYLGRGRRPGPGGRRTGRDLATGRSPLRPRRLPRDRPAPAAAGDPGAVTLRIAHLSDIHFGDENRAAVAAATARLQADGVDLTVVSGDLTRFGEVTEFEQAAAWLKGLPGPKLVTP